MSLDADKVYVGTIANAEKKTSQKDRQGLSLLFTTHEGDVYFSIWFAMPEEQASDSFDIREKARKMTGRAKETLFNLGLTPEELRDSAFWDDPSTKLAGKQVRFKTKLEKDKDGVVVRDRAGAERVGVAWVSAYKAPSADASDIIAGVFARHEMEKEVDDFDPFADSVVADD